MNTPMADRTHIGLFGKRNSGKSSLINAICNQPVSIVSDTLGTTTDPVFKSMEILPLGPVCFIDTPGLDDVGEIGQLRVKRAKDVLKRCDVALIVCGGEKGEIEEEIENICKSRNIPFIIVFNKSDMGNEGGDISVSAKTGENIDKLKEMIASLASKKENVYIADIINEGDTVVLVTPIDESAPKGRIILPQQQVLSEVLDKNAQALVLQPQQLEAALSNLKNPPKIVVTDSQAFGPVSKIVPQNIPLTSFSIVFSRKKGNLMQSVEGANILETLKSGDNVLISEGCTHHRQCGDIGSVKLPAMIKKFTGADVNVDLTSGIDFKEDLKKYSLIIHCGGCMLQDSEVSIRYASAAEQGIPITNYGIAMAKMQGILERVTEMF